ncbi:MAG: response regulator [Alphaproteobacteria bacterium]|nr:response regulator [Alphaproteobacteria bacterium]
MAVDKQKRVLVVDDSKAVCLNLRSFLKELGFPNVDMAEDGLIALEKLRADLPAYGLIISDWNMDRMNGYDLLRVVKQDVKTKHIPFIMITAQNAPENVVLAKKAGVNNYIIKPFTVATLKQRVEAVLGPLS